LAVVVVLSALVLDLGRPPEQQVTARALVGAIRLYRGNLSPRLGASCRFRPTCSRYAEAVILRHGAAVGCWLALRRLARCGPWTSLGTVDPPPAVA
jgi:uncharacterized protein